MRIVDVNLLLHAVDRKSPLHVQARGWLEESLSGGESFGFTWNVILGFLRLTTRSGLPRQPLPMAVAFDVVTAWLEYPTVVIVQPGPKHLAIMRALLAPLGTAGNLTSDAHLAALAIEQNAELCSCDNDFARFSGLRWRNPLA